jgi:hypothetical protein
MGVFYGFLLTQNSGWNPQFPQAAFYENWAGVKVKLEDFEFDGAAKHLLELKRKMADQNDQCSFLLILTATGGAAYTRDDGVHVAPLDCLKP